MDKPSDRPEPREFSSVQEVDTAIRKLERRLQQLEDLDVKSAVLDDTGAVDVAESSLQKTILEVFGPHSPEYREHEHLRIWSGPMAMGMGDRERIEGKERGLRKTFGIVQGLIQNLHEKREDLEAGAATPTTYFDDLNLHPRIAEVSRDLFLDGHHWEAVFAASKALVNYVKERSGRHDLDGAPLMRTVFSKNDPVLAFNERKDQTDLDEQEGTMHLFEGAVLAIRNPGGHSFPEGSEQRAVEYISLLSLLAFRVQEAEKAQGPTT